MFTRSSLVSLAALVVVAGMTSHAEAQTTAYAYVPNFTSWDTTVIDTRTNTVVTTIPVGFYPMRAAVSPDGRRALVVNNGTGDLVTVIDVATQAAVKTLHVGHTPYWVAIAPDGAKAYVANYGADSVSVIDMATETVGPTPIALPFASLPASVVFSPDGQRAIVANEGGNTLSVIDVATDTIVDTIPVDPQPLYIAVASDGHTVYLTHPNAAPSDLVGVVDVLAPAPEAVFSTAVGSSPRGFAISPDNTQMWVANSNSNSVSVLKMADGTLVDTLAVGAAPRNLAFRPDGAFAYVANFSDNTVSVVNVANRTVDATIPVGTAPHFVGMSPNLITSALSIASDADLTTRNIGRFVDFFGGALNLTGNWTTTRTISVLSNTTTQTTGTLDTGAFTATLNGNVINDGTLIKRGSGTLAMMGTSTNIGGIRLEAGTLAGTGTIAQLQATGGAVSPGVNGPGVLHAGYVTLAPDASLVVQLNGPNVGTGYDRLDATGTVALNDAYLELQSIYTPPVGAQFTIVTNATGRFAWQGREWAEGANLWGGNNNTGFGNWYRLSYHGGSGSDVVLTYNAPPALAPLPDLTITLDNSNGPQLLTIPLTITDDLTPPESMIVSVSSSNSNLVPPTGITVERNGSAHVLKVTPKPGVVGQTTMSIMVGDGAQWVQRQFLLTVALPRTYYLAEGSTGPFFSTDILIANPNSVPTTAAINFFTDDGKTVTVYRTLAPMSHLRLPVRDIPGMEGAAFSTTVGSIANIPLVVERTMWWDGSGYGAATEKASEHAAATWDFAEGSQGFFHTYFLLLNPNAVWTNVHIDFLLEDGSVVRRDYSMRYQSRMTIDAGSVPELINRSFGAHITFDDPGYAERAMYFGTTPLFSGGSAASGSTPANEWFLAEGATGTFFDTFVLIANPNDTPTDLTLTYLPASGIPVTKTRTLLGHQRLTINIAFEDPSLASAAVSTRVQSTLPVVVERSQYWPSGGWYESHTSAGETTPALKWGIAEGRVGGTNDAQTFILIANPGTAPADITATFLRADGMTLVKHFTVDPTSRFNINVIGGDNGNVPELTNEEFGAIIESTQPVIVEHSLYANSNGVIWAAGTNATATRLP